MTSVDNWTSKVDVGHPLGCWWWMGSLNSSGYGQHRRVYETLVGPIDEGLVLDHLCLNPQCVNPDHVEPVTQSENLRRSYRFRRGECPEGHRYTSETLYISPDGVRMCRPCRARNARALRARRRELASG